MTGEVVFVEDDEILRAATVQALTLAGLTVRAFDRAEPALAAITSALDGVVVSDIRMPRMDGIELLAAIRARDAELPVILVTGHGDVPMAVAALKDGAWDFLTKPFAVDHLVASVTRALEHRALIVENRRLRAAAAAEDSPMIGECAAIVQARATIRDLAAADVELLIEGESGTGKDLAAVMLHRAGPRRARPFVIVDCGALGEADAAHILFGHAADSVPHTRLAREGQVSVANHGTLLLDRVDRLPIGVQPGLLRVIEDREVQPVGAARPEAVNLRIVATGDAELADAVEAGRLREDLYHRLATTRLRLPPLRDRGDDRLILFAGFVEQARRALGRPDHVIGEAARAHIAAHRWPGNVRELRAFAFDTVMGGRDAVAPPPDLPSRVADFETAAIVDALRSTDGNVVRALALLKVPRKTLYYKLARYGIDPDAYRPRRSR